MSNPILNLEIKKYELKLDNFTGPIDLLCYLIEKNQMDIYQVNISQITDQYVAYIQEQQKLNLEIASEFLVMASNLLLIKSKALLPKETEDESELTEEELIRRILEYKRYKEIIKIFRKRIFTYSERVYKSPEKIVLPEPELEINFTQDDIVKAYKKVVDRVENRKNEYATNIEKIAIHDNFSVTDKSKQIMRELKNKPKLIFGKIFKLGVNSKEEVVTAFSGVLELSKTNKINTLQEKLFGDITITKASENSNDDIENDLDDENGADENKS